MKRKDYLKDRWWSIFLLVVAVMTSQILLLAYPVAAEVKIYLAIVPIFAYIVGFELEYHRRKLYFKQILEQLQEMDEAYLVGTVFDTPKFPEGRVYQEILEDMGKAMLQHVNHYHYQMEDYKDFIELWIHEIKTPIATGKLILENHGDVYTKDLKAEFEKIENYTEEALFYARSNSVEKDYVIKKTDLKTIVHQSVIKNKTILIENHVTMDIHDVEIEVATDSKWMIFILSQILQNAVKYLNEDSKRIELWAEERKEQVVLRIKDYGIGVKEGEVSRVFEKGFTGTNGRMANQKSTGIGLYLCKKLCEKLGMEICLTSKEGAWTQIDLIFPKGSYTVF